MKALSKQEARAWCEARSIRVTANDFLYYDLARRDCIVMELPERAYQVPTLANALLPYGEESPFRGALLWIRSWGVWTEHSERAGLRIVERIRFAGGETRSLDEAPGTLFDATELVDLHACFIQPLLMGWDAFLIPLTGDYFIATSHDEITCVVARTRELHVKLFQQLQNWNPQENDTWYFQGIGQ